MVLKLWTGFIFDFSLNFDIIMANSFFDKDRQIINTSFKRLLYSFMERFIVMSIHICLFCKIAGKKRMAKMSKHNQLKEGKEGKDKEIKEGKDKGINIFDFVKVKDVTINGKGKYHSLDNLLLIKQAMKSKGWQKKAFQVKDFLRIAGYRKSYSKDGIADPTKQLISALQSDIDDKVVKDFENHIGGRVAGLKRKMATIDKFKDINIGSNGKLVYIELI